ncbi:folate family ECF transporter S component [Enterococcus sp. BWB1-3]|uniref:folate family ECF transporter S component n=1 Tax=unclassified Enterococcus TaxID=2608891 RepID=UPI001923DD08|nr:MULTISPECIES: folate family ECF transporter S component [unclassified Enterococcus]MBL1227722.1 folate family ECF transporter S component [Enterococcus sp. BWB1-3]MCB5952091.1 folate family ECF transporter S component [Enterococcus sp. BWT-B8]MCB5954501.1 folate family ECF transporter S component [Enterococcus sp. CWB-B31]
MLRMKKRVLETRKLTLLALLIALVVVFTRFLSYEDQFLRISFTFIPESVMGVLFGPLWTGIGSAIADAVGVILFPKTGAYFPGFTLNAIITGGIYGFFYYRKELTWLRVFIATLLVTGIVHLFLTPLWLGLMYGVDLANIAWWIPRIIKNSIFFPVQVVGTYLIGTKLPYKQFLSKLTTSYK